MEHKKKILVVGDNPAFGGLVSGILGGDYEIQTASSGAAGLEKAKGTIPDLIFLDLGMPDMTGFDFARELSVCRETTAIPIIVDRLDLLQNLG